MKAKRKLADRIFHLGITMILVPLVLLVALLTIVFVKQKRVHTEYDTVVRKLHSDMDSIDKRLHTYTVQLNGNQKKIQDITRKHSLNNMKEQINFSVTQLLSTLIGHGIIKTDFDHTILLSLYLDNTLKTIQELRRNITSKDPLDKQVKITEKEEDKGKLKNLDKIDSLDLKIKELSRNSSVIDKSKLAKLLNSFSKNARMGNTGRVIFIIEHTSLHKHQIAWSTQPGWTGKFMEDFELLQPLRGLLISKNYMEKFMKFQRGGERAFLLYNLIPATSSSTDAKYNISTDNFYGMIPVWGTPYSLGVQTSMAGDLVSTLDSISNSLGNISSFLKIANVDIRNADQSTKKLHKRFGTETRSSNNLFLYIIIFAVIFVGVVFYLIIRSIQRRLVEPVLHIQDVTSHIVEGEYSARCTLETNDELQELSEAINVMLDRIVTLIQSEEDKISMQSDIVQLLDVVSQASNGDLTIRGQVSTPDFQAVMDAFNHMMSSIGSLVIKVRSSGNGVEHYTKLMLDSLKQILEKSTRQANDLDIAARKIKALGDRSQEITRMVEQIGSIAMETNTLALNATLEASRSGDRDTGISHLAEHVRQLADGLKKTKQDIDSFMGSIQLATNHAVQSMEEVLILTRETAGEARLSFETANNTHQEADQLAKSISIFKIKSQMDAEREVELKSSVKSILKDIKQTRKLIGVMDTMEFESMNDILNEFEESIREMGFLYSKAMSDGERSPSTDDEIPAIIED
ncbi:MAG: methyl-accepting chemotaxis protein [Deltaproteobacteria bacterium]|nr:methyl-accepting chemotaxis protein [Deltaproteobacteria bacterium]